MSITATAAGEYYTLNGQAIVVEVRESYADSGTVVQAGRTHDVSAETQYSTLPPLGAGATHADLATADAVGEQSKQPVDDKDSWHGTTPEQQTPTPTPTPTPTATAESTVTATPTSTADEESSPESGGEQLAYTGTGPLTMTAALLGGLMLLAEFGLIRLRRSRN